MCRSVSAKCCYVALRVRAPLPVLLLRCSHRSRPTRGAMRREVSVAQDPPFPTCNSASLQGERIEVDCRHGCRRC